MRISVGSGPEIPDRSNLVAVPVYAGKSKPELDPVWRPGLPKSLRTPLECGDFTGKPNTHQIVYGDGFHPRLLLVGLGSASDIDLEQLRRYGGRMAQVARDAAGERGIALLPSRLQKLDRESAIQAIAEGMALGSYAFDRYQKPKDQPPRISKLDLLLDSSEKLTAARRALRRGLDIAAGVNLAREVGNLPANDLGPLELATRSRKEGRDAGLTVRVLDEKALQKERMGALLGVGRGSSRAPRLIVLEYKGTKTRQSPLVFVGKAITFDTGGISLKPADGMQDMKFDMCGGAAVLGALTAIGRLRPERPVVGIIASAENMPDGSAIRPGDILTSASGLTIEIINTDAEGRLVLADGLHYAKRYKPELVVDLATLTGACVVALGSVHTGLFSRDPEIAESVRSAAAQVGEKMWPLPLDEEYFDLIRSEVADVKNSGGRKAGAITAAAFLARFIEGYPWVHLDIAGTGWTDQNGPYQGKGATGSAVRTRVELAFRYP